MPADLKADLEVEFYCPSCEQSFPSTFAECPDDGTRLILLSDADPLCGRVLEERFRVDAPIGRGGMGAVYRGIQVSVGRKVAIKVVHGPLAADKTIAKRFLREAKLASSLGHPNMVGVIDFGRTRDGVLYLVMEHIEGETLQETLRDGGAMDSRRACRIAEQICSALEAAHEAGVLHRDLKPANLMVVQRQSRRDIVKVLDFGIAKVFTSEETSRLTDTDGLVGTPVYMSPESVSGRAVDGRSDLYSLGLVLYELLVGHPPFGIHGEDLAALAHAHVALTPPPMPGHVPAALREIVDKLLEKDPDDRFQSAVELRAALAEVSLETPGRAVPALEVSPVPTPRSRNRGLLVAITLALAGAGVAAFFVLGGERERSVKPDEPKPTSAARAQQEPADAAPVPEEPVSPPVRKNDPPQEKSAPALVEWQLESTPPALVTIGGVDIGKTPLTHRLVPGEEELEIVFSRENYKSVKRTVIPQRDRDIVVTLDKKRSGKRVRPATKATKATKLPSTDPATATQRDKKPPAKFFPR